MNAALETTEGRQGYGSEAYATSLRHEGTPLHLEASGSWLIRRPIPGHLGHFDAVGCYPFLVCRDLGGLSTDLSGLDTGELITVTAVLDPLGDHAEAELADAFPDLLRPYKRHFVVELAGYDATSPSAHHRRNVRRGHAVCRIETVDPPWFGAEEWVGLYQVLIERHAIRGRAAFPPAALRAQLRVPGTTLLRARIDDETVGMVAFVQDGDRAYYHLGAFSELGYRSFASYALFDVALRQLSEHARVVLLGAGAGDQDPGDDGLVRFKRGWGAVERTARLGGRIVDRERYEALVTRSNEEGDYFPAYRSPARRRSPHSS